MNLYYSKSLMSLPVASYRRSLNAYDLAVDRTLKPTTLHSSLISVLTKCTNKSKNKQILIDSKAFTHFL